MKNSKRSNDIWSSNAALIKLSGKNPTTYISPRNIPADDPPNCRKRKFETEFIEDDSDYEKKYDEDDGDIVTYVDKPNTFL